MIYFFLLLIILTSSEKRLEKISYDTYRRLNALCWPINTFLFIALIEEHCVLLLSAPVTHEAVTGRTRNTSIAWFVGSKE